MSPLIFLITLVLGASRTAGDEGAETHHLWAAIGSSVFLPGVEIDGYTVYDMSRVTGHLVWTCHGGCNVRDPFTKRGQFYRHNGTFLLKGLRAEDNGTFELKINFTVKAIIHLHVMAPVTEPVLSHQEVSRNGSQCLIVLTCRAAGVGELNLTFLRNDEVIHKGVSTDNSSSWSMDSQDPATSGTFSCNVANSVSSNTTTFDLLPPATPIQQIMRLMAIASLLDWIFAVCILCTKYSRRKLTEQGQKGNDYNAEVDPDSKKPSKSKSSTAFYIAGNLLGFLKEIALTVICVLGYFFPLWWFVVPGVLLLCRLIFHIFAFINKEEETRVKIPSEVKVICDLAMTISNLFVIPAFSIAIVVQFSMLYRSPCGTMDRYPFLLSGFCVLLFVIYLVIKNKVKNEKKDQTEGTDDQQLLKEPNGDIEQAEDPNCEGPVPGLGDNPNAGQETPKQSDVLTVAGPEEPMIPKPEEDQPPEIPCKSPMTAAPNHENSDGTKSPEGQCVVTLEKGEVAFDKDREANG